MWFGRIPTAIGFYNRGNAFLKGREKLGKYELFVLTEKEGL